MTFIIGRYNFGSNVSCPHTLWTNEVPDKRQREKDRETESDTLRLLFVFVRLAMKNPPTGANNRTSYTTLLTRRRRRRRRQQRRRQCCASPADRPALSVVIYMRARGRTHSAAAQNAPSTERTIANAALSAVRQTVRRYGGGGVVGGRWPWSLSCIRFAQSSPGSRGRAGPVGWRAEKVGRCRLDVIVGLVDLLAFASG